MPGQTRLTIAIHGYKAMLLPADADAPDILAVDPRQRRIYSRVTALHMKHVSASQD